ncbi:MAG: divalent-cation tolerance protein CutA [Methylovirgula sp.]|nr:divalent-cation tolerance protein CutA [Methylovirgula sp.]
MSGPATSGDHAVVLTACGTTAAGKIAEMLVRDRLAACVQKLPVESTYRWKGGIETAQEVLLLIKIKTADYAAVEQAIRALHDYEIPEIIALPVAQGFAGYLSWIDEVTRRS